MIPVSMSVGIVLGSILSMQRTTECSPKFNGGPMAATLLMRQAAPVFGAQFPGLEMAPIYVVGHPDFAYGETGFLNLVYPSGNYCEVPLFQKLSDREEADLGQAGVRKKPIGRVVMRGECRYGCAQVLLVEVEVLRGDGEVVWKWSLEESMKDSGSAAPP